MKPGDKHVQKLLELADQMQHKGVSSDVVMVHMVPEFGALVGTLAESLDKTHRQILYLTWAIAVLTVLIVILTGVLVWAGK
jgi:hypothetical protein